ncbi:hypothetical protein L1D14_07345 [Vibrio tubiashii]|uniref:hypothetical protein n=1 Tax=Vibrio tubiashii TaxID=29498 RepID=UPI001EFCC57E|nr:hypothetical protein [Vibrio tubiashii]MCG9576052.1 hypothetical protein [Vibrio tubiashii]
MTENQAIRPVIILGAAKGKTEVFRHQVYSLDKKSVSSLSKEEQELISAVQASPKLTGFKISVVNECICVCDYTKGKTMTPPFLTTTSAHS